MYNFANTDEIKQLDPRDTLGSTEMLIKQAETAWNEVMSQTDFPKLQNINKLICCGMGASIYGSLVLKSLLGQEALFPIEIVSDYHIPAWADDKTLVVLTSYSGSTEEVLSCAEDAKASGCKILVITKGGALADFAKINNAPSYIFDGKLNPAGVPRLGNGYTILGLMGLLNKMEIIPLDGKNIEDALTRMNEKVEELKKRAMVDSDKFVESIPVIFAAEHLTGNAQILRNQFNETSKTFSSFFLIPDLNHHLMEGLTFPKEMNITFLQLQSKNYAPKIYQRFELTKEVVEKNNHKVHIFEASGATVYDDFLECMVYGSFLTLYLGLRHDQNPAVNPWVDYFKEKLK